jgi:thioredoxin 2
MMSGLRLDDKGVLTKCTACGTVNRQAFEHLGQTSRCGKCQAELTAPVEPVTTTSSEEFDRLVAGSRVPVLVDFWAPWCGPCRAVAPELQKVARALGGRLIVAKVNTDEVGDLAERYGIRSIPTFLLFRDGVMAERVSGSMSASAIVQFVGQQVA